MNRNAGDKMSAGAAGPPVIIVSGLPRSGTSLMMQMLKAGGLEILSDGNRKADLDNPKGYLEYEPVKSLRRDNSWLKIAEGKALKIISPLLPYLLPGLSYKIILMKRPMAEILASQEKMLARLGQEVNPADLETLGDLFARQSAQTERWLQCQKHLDLLTFQYRNVVRNPEDSARGVSIFLNIPLDIAAMVQVVDLNLYRNIESSRNY